MSHAPFNPLASPIKSKFKLITSQSSTNKNLTDNRLGRTGSLSQYGRTHRNLTQRHHLQISGFELRSHHLQNLFP